MTVCLSAKPSYGLVIRKNGKSFDPQTFANTPSGRIQWVKKLIKLPGIIACLEATGIYHFDLGVALHNAGVLLMVVNPKTSHNFAKVLLKNSKTDAVDAQTLAEYAERMDFVAWTRPSDEKLAVRSFARRIHSLTRQRAAAKNHLHALCATSGTPKAVLKDAQLAITQLQKRIDHLISEALGLINHYPELKQTLALLTSIKGVGETSAIALMGELLLLPPNLSHREWLKFAGLDPHVNAYFQHLVANGKKPLQAVCAVMRKLLHAIHGMLKHDQPFDNSRFYAIPVSLPHNQISSK
jgi:transposase